MGTGASAQKFGSPRRASNNTGPDIVEGSMQWLLACVDKEKEEKLWLSKHFDDKCSELIDLKQELLQLRTDLKRVREAETLVPTCASGGAVAQRPLMRGMAAGVTEKAQCDNAVWPEGGQISSPTNSTASKSSFQERRGLKLGGISTGIDKQGNATSKVQAVDPPSPVPEGREEDEKCNTDRSQKSMGRDDSLRSLKSTSGLLARRDSTRKDTREGADLSRGPSKEAQPRAASKGKMEDESQTLYVSELEAFKENILDEPSSPKRKMKGAF